MNFAIWAATVTEQNTNRGLYSKKVAHILPSRASYEVYFGDVAENLPHYNGAAL